MCGIAGFKGKGDEEYLTRATALLRHRGPDEQKTFCEGDLGFAFTRLAILDLTPSGSQPMWNAEGTLGIVFNGEVYNFGELRALLEQKGYQFRGHSDTEVILAMYAEFGEEFFSKLNGMFAIALYDKEKDVLILARDRFGKKPLYWTLQNGTLVFASELKAILAHPQVRKELCMESVNQYLALEYVPTPYSMFKNIFKLEAGTALTYQGGVVTKKRFWEPPHTPSNLSFAEALAHTDTLLEDSVKMRMVSDVPLGIFLSGGLDSGTVAYYAAKHTTEPLQTFSIGFEEASFDESKYAKEVAEFLGTQHHELIVSDRDIQNVIHNQLSDMVDEPMADASILPTYLLSAFTKKSVTVALGGDGADELLLGYPTFHAEKYARIAEKLPQSVINILRIVANRAGGGDSYFNVAFRAQRFLDGIDGDPRYRHERWLGGVGNTVRTSLLLDPTVRAQNPFLHIDPIIEEMKGVGRMTELRYEYLRTYLEDEVLVKVDRASMKASLEVRAPFLDYRLVEFFLSLPPQYLKKGHTGKYILRTLMKNRLPPHVTTRPKHGFAIPLAKWLRGALRPLAEELLAPDRIKVQGLFDHNVVTTMLKTHLDGRQDLRKELWTLIVFQLWYDTWYS